MARPSSSALAIALALAACSDAAVEPAGPDAKSPFCATSAECGTGNWCNPLGTVCEPRGTTFTFDRDIYPVLRDTCAGCHVAGVPDPMGTGDISVFAGGPDVAYASLVEGGTNCATTIHHLCVDEPKIGSAIARIVTHKNASGAPLLSGGYSDAWVQKLLHWTAAGAHRTNDDPDAAIADAPLPGPDAPLTHADAPLTSPDAPIVTTPDATPPLPDARPPDAKVFPDGPPDTTPPTGGNVTAAAVDACGVVMLTIQAATDDQTPTPMLRFEVCWSRTQTACQDNFVANVTFMSSGRHNVDLGAEEGHTLFFSGRAVDERDNASVPNQMQSAAIPTFLSWTAGGINVARVGGATTGATTYSVTWPAVSSTCPASHPLTVQAGCSGGSGCSCATAGDNQSATCTASSCEPVSVSVTARAGLGMQSRQGSFAMSYADVSPIFDVGAGGCRGCHPASYPTGPQFTVADIGGHAPGTIHCPNSFIYIIPGNPEGSLIYGVVLAHHWLCDPAGVNGHTFNVGTVPSDAVLLHCYIDGIP